MAYTVSSKLFNIVESKFLFDNITKDQTKFYLVRSNIETQTEPIYLLYKGDSLLTPVVGAATTELLGGIRSGSYIRVYPDGQCKVLSADKLTSSVKIGDASFDGSSNITLHDMGTVKVRRLSAILRKSAWVQQAITETLTVPTGYDGNACIAASDGIHVFFGSTGSPPSADHYIYNNGVWKEAYHLPYATNVGKYYNGIAKLHCYGWFAEVGALIGSDGKVDINYYYTTDTYDSWYYTGGSLSGGGDYSNDEYVCQYFYPAKSNSVYYSVDDCVYVLTDSNLYKGNSLLHTSTIAGITSSPSLTNLIEHDGVIHLFNPTAGHYTWNGSVWTKASECTCFSNGSRAISFNGNIHVFGGDANKKAHYMWNGSVWIQANALPVDVSYAGAVVYDNRIHLLGGTTSIHLTISDDDIQQSIDISSYSLNSDCIAILDFDKSVDRATKKIIQGFNIESEISDTLISFYVKSIPTIDVPIRLTWLEE